MKRRHIAIIALGISIPLLIAGVGLARLMNTYDQVGRYDCVFKSEGSCVQLQLADTPESREKGLSGRDSLSPTAGMLFVFEEPQLACIWMKDMKFPLDILWLDENKQVTQIEGNVSPQTYPESFCKDNTRYVIELNAGTSQKAGLKTGQRINF